MKVEEILVVTVVRRGKVDIGDMIVADATWGWVRGLENLSRGNVELGMPVRLASDRHRLSVLFTGAMVSLSERSVRYVSKRFGAASMAAIELSCLSTVEADVTENWNQGRAADDLC